jgi:peptidoglycan/xylan/chitin deacetylase (PgdA/CDA1 family)
VITLKVILAIVIGLLAIAGVDMGIPWLIAWRIRRQLRRRAQKAHALVLTFDDGPGSRLTPAILDALAKRNAKATFFLLGKNVPGRENLVRQIEAQGHEVCSHGYHHAHAWKTSPWQVLIDIVQGWRVLDGILHHTGGKYSSRPPYGKLTIVSLLYLWLKRVPICYWTVDSTDTAGGTVWNRQHAAEAVRRDGGGVVLLHDFDRLSETNDQAVIDSLNKTLDVAAEDHLQVMTFSELTQSESEKTAWASKSVARTATYADNS